MPNKVHGNTIKGAKLASERGQITEQSHAAVLMGEMTLQEARNIGTEDAPTDTPEGTAVQDGGQEAPRSASADARQDGADKAQKFCLCGCGEPVRGKKSRFRPGHDARLHSDLKRNLKNDPLLRNERFSPGQRAYAKERGLIAE